MWLAAINFPSCESHLHSANWFDLALLCVPYIFFHLQNILGTIELILPQGSHLAVGSKSRGCVILLENGLRPGHGAGLVAQLSWSRDLSSLLRRSSGLLSGCVCLTPCSILKTKLPRKVPPLRRAKKYQEPWTWGSIGAKLWQRVSG